MLPAFVVTPGHSHSAVPSNAAPALRGRGEASPSPSPSQWMTPSAAAVGLAVGLAACSRQAKRSTSHQNAQMVGSSRYGRPSGLRLQEARAEKMVRRGLEMALRQRPFGVRPETILPEDMKESQRFKELACCTDALLQSYDLATLCFNIMDEKRNSGSVGLYGDELDKDYLRGKAETGLTTFADACVGIAISRALQKAFPDDLVMTDLDPTVLPNDPDFTERVCNLLDQELEGSISKEDVLAWNEHANSYDSQVPAGGEPPERYWVVQPLDTFAEMRELKSYCISVALMEGGKPVVSSVVSPNTQFNHASRSSAAKDGRALFYAVSGHGSYTQMISQRKVDGVETSAFKGRPWKLICSENLSTGTNPFLNELGSDQLRIGHRNEPREDVLHDTLRVCKILGSDYPWMTWTDNALRWCSVAQGGTDAFWDFGNGLFDSTPSQRAFEHAAGSLIAEEAGVSVTDLDGKPLQWTGKTLEANRGVLAVDTSKLPFATMLRALEKSTKISTEEYEMRCAKRKELAKSFKFIFNKIKDDAATEKEKEAAEKVNELSEELTQDDDKMMDHTVKQFINRNEGVRKVRVD
mmetsp:Transcript_21492/g.50106  ORF Transcript_21492/g.50106 Transcript_21492/m.50106 type:complete len:581 (-) Transcript_21492:136-1878(-)